MAKRAKTKEAVGYQPEVPSDPFSLQTIYCGDNLDKLSRMPSRSVDLIYIDPPFNSNRNYEVFWGDNKEKRAFEDRHESTKSYIEFMYPRCVELHRVLKSTGSLYYHCDWHSDGYVRCMLDQIFGESQFQSQIVWQRTTAHNDAKRQWGAVHDSIFFYTKTQDYHFVPEYTSYKDSHLSEKYRHKESDGRVYQLDNLRSPQPRPNLTYEYKGYKPHPNGWAVSREKMEKLDSEGRLYFPKNSGGRIRVKRYLHEMKGMPIGNVWTDISPVNSMASERVGYPTQKPVPLLERIIKASSEPDDIVLDAFCGCGTALEAAQRLDRRWIGIDISPTACRVMSDRLKRECKLIEGRDFFVRDLPKTAEQLRAYPHFEFENWAVNALNTVLVNGEAIGNRSKVNDKGIDGRIYPIRADKSKSSAIDLFGPTDDWFPVQVKQVDTVTRDEIDKFYGAMKRQGRDKGFFISFEFSSGAMKELKRLHDDPINGLEIIPLTVEQILAEEVRYRV